MTKKNNIDELLNSKAQIDYPKGLDEKIIRRIHAEKSKKSSGRGLFSIFAPQNYYAMAASFAAILIAVSVVFQSGSPNLGKVSSAEAEIEKLSEEVQFYETATNLISDSDPADDIEKDLQEIQQIDELLNLLNS